MLESGAMIKRCKKQSKEFSMMILIGFAFTIVGCGPPISTHTLGPTTESDAESRPLPTESSSDEQEPDPTSESSGSIPVDSTVLNPLTGQAVEDPTRLNYRPILIKVTLFPRNNRPQWGLSSADLVFEHYTEGGLSRFSALFYGQEAEIVGPIRSARFVDIQLVRMYGALFAYGSADQRVLDQIDHSEFADRAVREFPAGCPPLCRIDPIVQNHLVTDTRALQAYYQERGIDLSAPDMNGLSFSLQPPPDGEPGTDLSVTYSEDSFHQWRYDPVSEDYHRFQETGEGPGAVAILTDRSTGEPISAANVVILQIPHELYARTPEIVDIQLHGEGDAIAFRNGQSYPVRWIRPFPEGVLTLTFPGGEAYTLKSGNTWFEIIGASSMVRTEPDGRWEFQHIQP